VREKNALPPLGGNFEPVAQVESKVVAVGGTLENERKYGEEGSQGDEDEVAMATHAVMVRYALHIKRLY
jgi:hypothetical protein